MDSRKSDALKSRNVRAVTSHVKSRTVRTDGPRGKLIENYWR